MIRILIIEDEIPARKKLKRFIGELSTQNEIVAEIDTVERGISFLNRNNVDIIFSDIKLLDGSSFEIFKEVSLSCPIIFITAYDQFLMDAFDTNGIAYLLKPYSKERFQSAWDKFLMIKSVSSETSSILNNLLDIIEQTTSKTIYKNRYIVYKNKNVSFLDTENISLFEACNSLIFAYDKTGKKHLLKESVLKEIQEQIDPSVFFRINRSEIINKFYIETIERNNKNTLAIKLKGIQKCFITSQFNTAPFRHWLEQ